MSMSSISAAAPVVRQVRAYFAPVDRTARLPTIFDPATNAAFPLDKPPQPWISLGAIREFARKGTSLSSLVSTGIPASATAQARETVQAEVSFEFLNWSKLTMALATGSQHMNVLASSSSAPQAAMGAPASAAVPVLAGSTATRIALAADDALNFAAGQTVAVDADYGGQTGYIGAPIAAAFLRQPLADADYLRRATFNVGLITQVESGALTLADSLPGGPPNSTAKVQRVCGFVDREGGSFFQEWSGLFVMEGSQGERVFFYYPRLQAISGAEESALPLAATGGGSSSRIALKARFLAFSVIDPLDGERIACYRSFIPAPATE